MNDRQSNKLSMFLATQKIINRYSCVWSNIPSFCEVTDSFTEQLFLLQQVRKLAKSEAEGFKNNKFWIENALIERAIKISSIIHVYAEAAQNPALKDMMDLSPSDLLNSKDTIILYRCNIIYEKAVKLLVKLRNYGLTPFDIDDLEERTTEYSFYIIEPSLSKEEINMAINNPKATIMRTDNILRKLDKLMDIYKCIESPFYTSYFISRSMGGLGNGSDHDILRTLEIPKVDTSGNLSNQNRFFNKFINNQSFIDIGKTLGLFFKN